MDEQVFKHIAIDSNNDESKFTPVVVKDDCQYHSNNWKQTILKFNSYKFIRLPITDFAPVADNDVDSMFGIELGPVCFA